MSASLFRGRAEDGTRDEDGIVPMVGHERPEQLEERRAKNELRCPSHELERPVTGQR